MAHDVPTDHRDVLRRVTSRIEGAQARTFAEMLYGGNGETLAGFEPAWLARQAEAGYAAFRTRPRGRHVMRARSETPEPGGTPVTVVEIANDDMPFLVDSIAGQLQAKGLNVRQLVHPILKVSRQPDGTLDAILGPGDRNWGDGSQDSFIQIVLDPLAGTQVDDLVRELSAVLDDVRNAVTDWQSMVARLDRAITSMETTPPPLAPGLLAETLAFCRWLRDGQFTFLGLREQRLSGDVEGGTLEAVPGSSLGVLRAASARTLSRNRAPLGLSAEVKRHLASADPLIVTKSNLMSRVHRRVHMDYVGLKLYGPDGTVTGELRMVGLFTSQAYTQPTRSIPLIRQKVETVSEGAGYPPQSHAGKSVANILETFPRDELFQIPADVLTDWVHAILDLEVRPRLRLLVRRDRFERYVSALVYVPRDRFSTATREKIGQALARAFAGRVSSFTPSFTEGPLVRVHYVIGRNEGQEPVVDLVRLEADIAASVRSWTDQLTDLLTQTDAARGPDVARRYAPAFSAAYMSTFPPARALVDIARIERLSAAQPIGIDFYRDPELPAERVRAALFRLDGPIPLSERVPVLENLGFSVIDERSDRIAPRGDGGIEIALHDMMLATADGLALDLERHAARMEAAFLAVVSGEAENDWFNRLIVSAGADWREAALLRALASYMRQLGLPFGSRYIAGVLVTHAGVARELIELFRTRFDPALHGLSKEARQDRVDTIARRIDGALAGVPSLDEDRILRGLLATLSACVRTNYFAPDGRAALALKIDTKRLDIVPHPKPFREIFVYSPRVEGVHLRFEAIARGGLRWSDRAQDYRTEVLGLCKAQQVKNTVIVPSGAKGGFLPKRLPKAGSRDEFQKEGVASYRLFVSSLLSVTDNIVAGRVVPPADVVRHDADDPYLVVAADKGTATFSDLANGIAAERGFWLDDAFASGGSAGYDHKVMGITARGAWECVKRHFREIDVDIQTTPFRVAGVGDMSGDVFGNGMLLSPHIRLVAAFDHRDIFIDPDPDAATSFAERERLFRLPRSSWRDYDKAIISAGGGVYSRQSKAVPLSTEAAALLGLPAGDTTPNDVLKTILKLDVDLLWFGGIGTYVRASTETEEQAGDRANDAIRISGADLRAKVIGEGANLGLTQRGRIEAAGCGVRLNTDFIDNSAGVNSSDIEVNIKIALRPAVSAGRLPIVDRNTLLASMTNDVAAACLVNNYQQSLAISLAERRGSAEIGDAERLIAVLEGQGLVDRKLEALPSRAELEQREAAGRGLTRPEIAVLLSWSKIALSRELLAGSVPDDPECRGLLLDYFPPALRSKYHEDLERHRLSREIITTRITNSIINRGGPTFVARLADETGRSAGDIAEAYLAVRAIFGLPEIWRGLDALDGRIPGALQLALYAETQEALARETTALLRSASRTPLGQAVARYAPAVAAVSTALDGLLDVRQNARRQAATSAATAAGVPHDLADRIAALAFIGTAIHARNLAGGDRPDAIQNAAGALFSARAFLRVDDLEAKLASLRRADYFDRLAARGALGDLDTAGRAMVAAVLAEGITVGAWLAREAPRLVRAKASLDEIAGSGELSVSRLVVAAAQVRDLARD
jgi:glutamate dehydrogenase